METTELNQQTLGTIVADDFRAASILSKAGIDFCCGGKKTLLQACEEKKLDSQNIISQLNSLNETPINPGQNFKDWDVNFLIDYIINTHHKYVLKTLPDLVFYTQKIAKVHGAHHLELNEVADLVTKINTDLLLHLDKEEKEVFPAIKSQKESFTMATKAMVELEIEVLEGEHEFAGDAMDRINQITSNYKVPDDGCGTYQVAFQMLKQFEDDLHVHVHLENNILFPKALRKF